MKKLTAFQWYIEQHNIIVRYDISIEERFKRFSDIIEKTKQMEKEHIIQAIIDTIVGSNKIYDKEYPEVREAAEQYYNETYEDNK